MKDYLSSIVDLTGDARINPPTLDFGDNEGSHGRPVGQIKSIPIHHDAEIRPHDYDSVARYVRQAAERADLGPGLPYNYRIDNTGVIFYCRPLTTWLNNVGSSENPTTLAICLDGNFETQMPTREQFEALYQLLVNLCTQHPEFPATWPDVRPHCDYFATACCGANLRDRIRAIQDQASAQAQLLNVGDYDWPELQPNEPAPAPAPQPSPEPADQRPEWQRNLTTMPKETLYTRSDGVQLVNMETGGVIKTYPQGTAIEVGGITHVGGQEYQVSTYAVTHTRPNGIRTEDLTDAQPSQTDAGTTQQPTPAPATPGSTTPAAPPAPQTPQAQQPSVPVEPAVDPLSGLPPTQEVHTDKPSESPVNSSHDTLYDWFAQLFAKVVSWLKAYKR